MARGLSVAPEFVSGGPDTRMLRKRCAIPLRSLHAKRGTALAPLRVMTRVLLCLLAGALACAPAHARDAVPAAADTCTSCHAELPGALRDPVRLVKGDVHSSAAVSCAGCHGGDPSAKTGREAHVKDFVARPADSAGMAAFCGRCHKEPAANYLKGPHQ